MLPDEFTHIDVIHASDVSRVILVSRPDLGEVVAKIPPLNSRRATTRFRREINLLTQAAGPNVMPVIEHGEDFSWFVMPRALRSLEDITVPVEVDVALEVLESMASALATSHARGIVHRDIKPTNILELRDGKHVRWVVADFGIARDEPGMTTSDKTVAGALLGTQSWAAPEQWDDAHTATPATDVYSAGLVLNWLLTAQLPRPGQADIQAGTPISGPLRRATSQMPERRYTNLEEFLAACRDQEDARRGSIEDLLRDRAFDEASHYFIRNPSQRAEVMGALTDMEPRTLAAWVDQDAEGLADTFEELLDDLAFKGIGRLNFHEDIDPFLIRGVLVLEKMLSANTQRAEGLAESVFGAIAQIHQFAPARKAIKLLEKLSGHQEASMRLALHGAGAWDFFCQMAQGRGGRGPRSGLLTELAEG